MDPSAALVRIDASAPVRQRSRIAEVESSGGNALIVGIPCDWQHSPTDMRLRFPDVDS